MHEEVETRERNRDGHHPRGYLPAARDGGAREHGGCDKRRERMTRGKRVPARRGDEEHVAGVDDEGTGACQELLDAKLADDPGDAEGDEQREAPSPRLRDDKQYDAYRNPDEAMVAACGDDGHKRIKKRAAEHLLYAVEYGKVHARPFGMIAGIVPHESAN